MIFEYHSYDIQVSLVGYSSITLMIFEYHIGDTQLYTGCIIDCTQRDN